MEECFITSDGAAHVPGLLNDQARMGAALLKAHGATAEAKYLERAKELGEFILARLKNPEGGYYDLAVPGSAYLSFRLTLIEQNGAAVSFSSRWPKPPATPATAMPRSGV